MTDWADLESTLDPVPVFPVQAPDGRRDWSEIDRQGTFLSVMRWSAPRVLVYPNANAGKRNPATARKEGIRAGVFDLTCVWRQRLVAYIELKGYSKAGRPGVLSAQQIEFGNRLIELGVPCACFFDPYDAAEWLRGQSFPVAEVRRAA
ncbi:hypothetical protein [Pelagerythrobacter aerophilus]|uniref:VRR-NUC domain-containing protein n=1 Tax=Pelagerythrobacter aerophilus TaxID=2306995 RepID=A0A418NJT2_9SPHN|nr:hypothetical protein [Pelagerythrobacter aerophilus]RIV79555.1 hypothetical protein D2V04_06175 [Pelagerythrobacter aerophilus]